MIEFVSVTDGMEGATTGPSQSDKASTTRHSRAKWDTPADALDLLDDI